MKTRSRDDSLFKSWRRILVLAVAIAFVPATSLAQSPARDTSSNAIILGGAFTQSELAAKMQNGDGRHSAKELQNIFSSHNISVQDLKSTDVVSGRVTKSGKVIVGDRVVATNAVSMGRDPIPGSTRDGQIFMRPTHVSFQQNSLPAFVSLRNNQFQFAVIKSCGNIVQATPKKPKAKRSVPIIIINQVIVPPTPPAQTVVVEKPVPQPPVLPQTGGTAAAGLVGMTALSAALAAYYRSRRNLVTTQKTKF